MRAKQSDKAGSMLVTSFSVEAMEITTWDLSAKGIWIKQCSHLGEDTSSFPK